MSESSAPTSSASTRSDADLAASVAAEAGALLLRVRAEHAGTLAGKELGRVGDDEADRYILDRLRAERPGDVILSEESVDDPARLGADRVWIVDPLDGSREYGLDDRPDWAVHVALWSRGDLVAGAVAQPALDVVYSSDGPFPAPPARSGPRRIVVSDSRAPAFVNRVAERLGAEVVPMGSAGAKAMAVVRGDVDAYLHAGGQWEWDSAAPVAVARAAGLYTARLDGSPLEYNREYPYLPDLVIARADWADDLTEVLADVVDEAPLTAATGLARSLIGASISRDATQVRLDEDATLDVGGRRVARSGAAIRTALEAGKLVPAVDSVGIDPESVSIVPDGEDAVLARYLLVVEHAGATSHTAVDLRVVVGSDRIRSITARTSERARTD